MSASAKQSNVDRPVPETLNKNELKRNRKKKGDGRDKVSEVRNFAADITTKHIGRTVDLFFLVMMVKTIIRDDLIKYNSVCNVWEQAVCIISTEELLEAFNLWKKRNEKCISIGGEYVEK